MRGQCQRVLILKARIKLDLIETVCPKECEVYDLCLHWKEKNKLSDLLSPYDMYEGN